MAIQRGHTTSIYLTYKVFQLINQLRRRLRKRVGSNGTKDGLLGSETSLGLQDDALLPRLSGVPVKNATRYSPNRICKKRTGRSGLKPQTLGKDAPGSSNRAEENVQRMLKDLDGSCNPNNALSTIAANNKLFIERNEPNFERYSLKELIRYLSLVHDAIDVLFQARSQYDDQWLICQGNEIGLVIDEAFIANYEHLLLSLRRQLIDALLRKVVESLLEGGQDKRQRRLLNWFTEYANNCRPLSTTWPWSIRPSLAVLWGVCWMFYDRSPRPGQQQFADNAGFDDDLLSNFGIPQSRLLGNHHFAEELHGWQQPQPGEYRQFGLDALSNNLGLRPTPPVPGTGSDLSSHHVSVSQNARAPLATQPPQRFRNSNGTRHTIFPLSTAARHEVARPIGGPGVTAFSSSSPADSEGLSAYNTYASGSNASPPISIQAEFSPGSSGIATGRQPAHQQLQVYSNFDVAGIDDWQQTLPYANQLSPLPPHQGRRASHHLTVPALRVNDQNQSPDTQGFTAPPFFQSSPIYAPGTPQAPHSINLRLDTSNINSNDYNNNIMGATPKSPLLQQPIQFMSRERTPTNNNSNMPTPVSIKDPHSPLRSPMDPQRERRISNASSHPSVPRQESESRSSPEVEGSGLSPRRGHAYKRSEDPPRNRDNKMVCKHKECANLTFDRKCEWSKHMDKHDRPYKCNVKGCEKLQGFTYSGGLLRHEREVHKMHGGTKKSLYCPFADCKRSSGAGFTRKENLAEHVRRVHRTASMSSTDLNAVIKAGDAMENGEEKAPVETQEEEIELGKRKRSVIADPDPDEDLREEVKRLKQENEDVRRASEEKDQRLKQLEEAVMHLQGAQAQGTIRS